MACLNKVKNLTDLIEVYEKIQKLKELVYLVIIDEEINPTKSKDLDEMKEIKHMSTSSRNTSSRVTLDGSNYRQIG